MRRESQSTEASLDHGAVASVDHRQEVTWTRVMMRVWITTVIQKAEDRLLLSSPNSKEEIIAMKQISEEHKMDERLHQRNHQGSWMEDTAYQRKFNDFASANNFNALVNKGFESVISCGGCATQT